MVGTTMKIEEYLKYDALLGEIVWIKKPSLSVNIGDIAGCLQINGYRRVTIKRKGFYAHRLIWMMHEGPISKGMEIDHIDGNPCNNQLANLRLATHSQNQHNSTKPNRNTSGVKGVSWCNRANKWRGQVMVNWKSHSRLFNTIEQAESWVKDKRDELHIVFANNGS